MKFWIAAAWTLVLLSALGLGYPASALAKTEIHFWHAMTGQLGDAVNELVKQFNASQNEYEVKPLRKGTYPETLTAAIAAYRQKNPPHIVQVFEVGTQTMMLSGAVLPVYQLFAEQGFKIDWKEFIAPVVGYYSKDGNLYSMPFNSSTPILYYNKDAFAKAGLDPAKPPQTWKQVEEYSKKLIGSGAAKCGFSTGWPSWTMVENMHAWHDQPFATKRNGFDGLDAELLINREFGVKHISQLAAWQNDKIYSYGGRAGTADPKFVSGECAMYIQSVGADRRLHQGRAVQVGDGAPAALGAALQEGHVDHRRRHAVGHEGQARGREPRHRPVPQVRVRHAPAGVVACHHRLSRHLEPGGETARRGLPLRAQPRPVHRVRRADGPAAHAARRARGQEAGARQARARGHRE
jgi:ABC-type glycerol-3-phosphate transport system substrate-binding protein